jgi:galactokinase
MVDVALAAGALGAQVCGAGLGGSVMVLVPDDQAQPLIEQMTRRYYQPTARQPCVLPVRPSGGAGLL